MQKFKFPPFFLLERKRTISMFLYPGFSGSYLLKSNSVLIQKAKLGFENVNFKVLLGFQAGSPF